MREEAILCKMRAGDPAGLEALMDRYLPYVSAVVWNILRGSMSPEDGEETASDVFLAAWEQAGELQPGRVKAWLGAVARHKAKNKLRQAGQTLPLEDDVLDIPGPGDPAGELERAEEQAMVRRAVFSLPEPDQEIFLRYYYYAQSVKEIAAALTASAFAVAHIAGAGELMQNFFKRDDAPPLTSGQIGALDQVGKTFGEGVTDNGATITPVAAIADKYCYYLRLRIEAPEGTVLPDLDPDADGAYQLWGKNWPEEKLEFTSETGDPIGGYGARIEALPDDDPTDNVKEFVVRYEASGAIGEGIGPAVFNNGSAKLLTIHGLWIQSPYKEYTPVFTGEFVLDVGGCFDERVLSVDCGGADYRDETGYGYTTWLDWVELSPLSITVSYRNNVNESTELREGVMFVPPGFQGMQVVLKDGTVALDYPPLDLGVPDGWDPAVMLSGGPGEAMENYTLLEQPLALDQVDYIKFGEHIIPVSAQ